MKKSIFFILAFTLLLALPFQVWAKQKVYTEKEIDQILVKAGMPQSYIDDMELDTKQMIIGRSGEGLEYTGRSVEYYYKNEEGKLTKMVLPDPSGVVTPQGTIDTADLSLWFDTFTVYVNGVKHKDVYPQFLWYNTGDIDNDKLSVSVPEGWQLISGEYSCRTYRSGLGPYSNSWTMEGDCGGRPSQISIYGYTWEDLSTHGYDVWYKGTMYFRMKKIDSNAMNRVVGNYAQDVTFWGGASFTVNLGWLSIGYTVSSGSIDTAGFDKDFTY